VRQGLEELADKVQPQTVKVNLPPQLLKEGDKVRLIGQEVTAHWWASKESKLTWNLESARTTVTLNSVSAQ